MKIRFLVFLLCIFNIGIYHCTLAQKLQPPQFGNMISFGCTVTESMRALQITSQSVAVKDTAVDDLFKPWMLKDKVMSAILLGVKLNPKLTNYELLPLKSFSKSYAAFRISDQSDAIVIAMGITKDNVNDYRYHVVLNDSAEVVHWSIPKLDKNYGAAKPYGFIGKFNYPGKQALVEVINIKDYQIRDGIMLDWRQNFKPVITNVLVNVPRVIGNRAKDANVNYKPPFNIKHDPLTNEITEIEFEQDSVSQIHLIFREHPTIVYNVTMVNMPENENGYWNGASGDYLQPDFMFNNFPQAPGKYEILIRPQLSGGFNIKGQTLHIPVTILPHSGLEKKASLKQLLPYVMAALIIIGLLFWLYRWRSNIKLAKSIQAKQTVNLKLRAIRSQLNPHFMFNALTSIQNLVNKNDMWGANHYLARFADLTRRVLNTGERDLVSLEDEINILDDYLQMEQLRFSFQYELKVADDINIANIEVPAMLLQPFLENAVKHGVANLREKGIIVILINQTENDLVFSITDNGKGFQQKRQETANSPFGLKLSEERIQLMNEVYKGQPVSLVIKSDDTGTTVTLSFNNWIS